MSTATLRVARRGVLRHSPWDALLVALAAAHGALLLTVAWSGDRATAQGATARGLAVVAVGLWWNSNTVAHNFIHRPFFRGRALNALFALYLSALLGVPQALWRDRHLAHHAGVAWRLRPSRQLAAEVLLVLAVWGALAAFSRTFFVTAYLPGYALGLGLCWLHGYYEHSRGTVSHYGFWYNLLFFNDGYHVEHHAQPGAHWTELPRRVRRDAPASRWPAVLRSPQLQRFVLARHDRAFRRLLPQLNGVGRVAVVGGGLFPRTLLVLRRLLPDASFVVIDRSAENLAVARALAPAGVRFEHACYDPALVRGFDMAVFPLAFVGDRAAIYSHPPAPTVLVHDWVWRRRGTGAVVSWLLLKRLNRVEALR